MLHQAEEDNFPNEDELPPLNLFEIFCPWLFDATAVDSKRGRGAIVAYTLLCEMFLQMRLRTYDPPLLTHFYRVLIQGLSGEHSSIAWCIIRNTRALFWLNLPGAEVIIPYVLDQVELSFGPKGSKNVVPEKVQVRFVALLGAMVCIPSHYGRVNPEHAALFDRVVHCVLLVCGYAKVNTPKTLCSVIGCLGMCVFEEVYGDRR